MLAEEQLINNRFKHIEFMLLLKEPVNEEDQSWHKTEKELREKPIKYPGLDESPKE